MLRVAVEMKASISVPSIGAFGTVIFTWFCIALVLHREGGGASGKSFKQSSSL